MAMSGRLRVAAIAAAVVSVAVLAAGCVTTQQASVGQQHQDVFRFATGLSIPLPEGNWTTVASVTRRNNDNILLETVTLVQVENNQVQGLIVSRTNLDAAAGGWTSPQLCQRNNIHHLEVLSYSTRDASCWGVVHADFSKQFTGYWGEVLNPYLEHLRSKNIAAPKAMIDAEFYEARTSRFVTVRYYRNPEADGFPPPVNAAWSYSDWNIQNVAEDPKKSAYIRKIIAWAKDWQPRLRESL